MITSTTCRECAQPIPYKGNGRPAVLCSDQCREADARKPWYQRTPDHELPRAGRPNRRARQGRPVSEIQQREALRKHLLAVADGTAPPLLTAEQVAAEEWRDYLADTESLPTWMPVNAQGFMSRADLRAAFYAEFGEDNQTTPADIYAVLSEEGGWLFTATKLRGVRGFRVIPDDDTED